MTATIYTTQQAYETSQTIKDMDYHDRAELCDDNPDFENHPGYRLKNANYLPLQPLPIHPTSVMYNSNEEVKIELPANLRGCIFENAPDLPEKYAEIVSYWSGPTQNSNDSGAIYFQCPLNTYMVELESGTEGMIVQDRLLSEGIVVVIRGLAELASSLTADDFIEVHIPVDENMLGIEPDMFRSTAQYGMNKGGFEIVYLKVSDILASPSPDHIYIDLFQNELIDYGYWY